MNCEYPRLMLAAPKSGSGKTMMTCGLLTAFLNREISCRSFKCGPDYIDPMFHKYVLNIDGGNLDTFFLEKERVRAQFMAQAKGAGLSVIEGVMGYYDGVGGDSTWASSYEVACTVDAPVVLVLDCKGASLSLAAMAKGFLEYRENSHIRGVILNRTSELMAERLKPAMEELGLKVYGYLPDCEEGRLDSRHLGLVLPGEQKDLKEQLDKLAGKLEETIDMDGLLRLAQSAGPLPESEENTAIPPRFGESAALSPESLEESAFLSNSGKDAAAPLYHSAVEKEVLIGLAQDEAFCFYYQENLRLLEEMGAKLIPFSPIHDKKLPEGIQGILFGGGYPELYPEELSQNKSMMQNIREASERFLPILAECGGFMYLHEELEIRDNKIYPMAGIIPGKAFPTSRLLRFGYIEAFPLEDGLFLKKGESIRGHEFHYWDSTNNGSRMEARKPGGNRSWNCVHAQGNLLAGFPHFYYPSNPVFARRFLEACRNL